MTQSHSNVAVGPGDLASDDILVLDRRLNARTVAFLGLDFAPLTPEMLFKRVVAAANQRAGLRYLVTPNVDQIVRLSQNPDYKSLHQDAWANVNDSRILELLAHVDGIDLPACPGSDLTARILAEAITPDEPAVFIGGSEAVIDAIKMKYGLNNVRWYDPPMGLRTNPAAVEAAAHFCADNPARFYFLCVGSPQQEMIARAIKHIDGTAGFALCVGASLEFLAGTRKRAPRWMQSARLEWLYRLITEPCVLWRRYLVEGPRIFGIWRRWREDNKNARRT
jgi:N-acetylglucosaminyldiphosphoundecaprenol N-acetyl-beta-D-mannosaminyltransferase